jgi:hypothetical protein
MSNLLDKASILLTPTAYNDGSMLSVKPENGDGDFTFSRSSAATRVNAQGLVENVQIISSELVSNGNFSQESSELITNGDFATDSDWTKDSSWSISGGKANYDATSTGAELRQLMSSIAVGKTIKIQFDISDVAATKDAFFKLDCSGAPESIFGYTKFSQGTYTYYHTITSGFDRLTFTALNSSTGGAFSITNISVKEVGQDWQLGGGWSIGDGEATATSSANGQRLGQYILTPTVGKTYKVTYEIKSITQGAFRVWLGGVLTSTDNTDVGVYTFSITATDASTFYIRTVGVTSGSVANISVKEITDDTDIPRIDYTDGCGSWLLEGQSTNLATKSENISGWGFPTNVTTTQNYGTSPDGSVNSTRLQFTANGFMNDALTLTSGTEYTLSIYAKRNDTGTQSFGFYVDGIPTIVGGITLSDEWQRFTYTYTASSNSSIGLAGNSGADVSVFGFQTEQQSYATSYIPTNGATSTRLQDIANNSGNSTLINSTEGVLYAEISLLSPATSSTIISLSDGGANRLYFEFFTSNRLYAIIENGSSTFSTVQTITQTNNNKLAFKYSASGCKLYINGTGYSFGGLNFSSGTLDTLNFATSNGTSSPFYGKTKAIAVYKEALTDAELQSLTTI